MYDNYPIEQLARSASTRFQMGFARLTMHLMPRFADVAFEPSTQGLKILAASEPALHPPGELLRRMHAGDVRIDEPRVRLRFGAAGGVSPPSATGTAGLRFLRVLGTTGLESVSSAVMLVMPRGAGSMIGAFGPSASSPSPRISRSA